MTLYSGIITIVDDDSTIVSITNTEYSIDEDDGNFVVNFLLSQATDIDVSITLDFIDDVAIGGQDFGTFTLMERTFKILKGQTRGSFSIPIMEDIITEGAESFSFTVASVIGARIVSGDSRKNYNHCR